MILTFFCLNLHLNNLSLQLSLFVQQPITKIREIICLSPFVEVNWGQTIVQTIWSHMHFYMFHVTKILGQSFQFLYVDVKIKILNFNLMLSFPRSGCSRDFPRFKLKRLNNNSMGRLFCGDEIFIVALNTLLHSICIVKLQ